MATSGAISGVGTTLKREQDATPNEWVALAEVKSISGPGMSRDRFEVTNLDSTGGYKEWKPGFRDGGELRVTFNYSHAVYTQLLADYADDDPHSFQITLNNTHTLTFDAFPLTAPLNINTTEAVTIDCTFQITGEVVYA